MYSVYMLWSKYEFSQIRSLSVSNRKSHLAYADFISPFTFV